MSIVVSLNALLVTALQSFSRPKDVLEPISIDFLFDCAEGWAHSSSDPSQHSPRSVLSKSCLILVKQTIEALKPASRFGRRNLRILKYHLHLHCSTPQPARVRPSHCLPIPPPPPIRPPIKARAVIRGRISEVVTHDPKAKAKATGSTMSSRSNRSRSRSRSSHLE